MDEREQLQQRIFDLTSYLTSPVSEYGDWKVIKCYESYLIGAPMPYNVNELHEKRQAWRDEIDRLKEQIKELDAQPQTARIYE